ncbi:MAG TPA: 30S ribosomal protein S11 [Candidatus Moranbacteria bacterium]|nr:30S ribosomal protein S11 [Candidatus Moranbacteria bacterium]
MAEEKDIKKEEIKTTEAVEKTETLEVEKKAEEKVEEKKKVKKAKRQVFKGKATIKCTYNNTIVSISDINGGVLGWSSSGLLGFKGAKKATPYAATQVVGNVSEKVKKYGVKELDVFVKGVGSGRESSIRALANNGFNLVLIKDITPIPHNGCRPKKPRRV